MCLDHDLLPPRSVGNGGELVVEMRKIWTHTLDSRSIRVALFPDLSFPRDSSSIRSSATFRSPNFRLFWSSASIFWVKKIQGKDSRCESPLEIGVETKKLFIDLQLYRSFFLSLSLSLISIILSMTKSLSLISFTRTFHNFHRNLFLWKSVLVQKVITMFCILSVQFSIIWTDPMKWHSFTISLDHGSESCVLQH